MVWPGAIAMVLLLLGVSGCRDTTRPGTRAESATARAQCEREAQTNEPPGSRGSLVGAFATDVNAVKAEYRRLYQKDWPGFGGDRLERLVLCYYDVPVDQAAVTPPGELGPIERYSIVVDDELNSAGLHGGPKSAVAIRAIN